VQEQVLAENNAAVVYVAQKDEMPHLEIIENLAQEYGEFLNIALYVVDDAQESSSDLKK